MASAAGVAGAELMRQAGILPRQGNLRVRAADLLETVAKHRDRRAFSEIYAYFAPRLKAYALRQGASLAMSEELVQETMLSVWRRSERFDASRATASTWIFTILRNKRIDMLRRERHVEDNIDDFPELSDDARSPEDSACQGEVGEMLREAMQQLPDEQIEVIHLAYYAAKSHVEIADTLGVPLGTVKSRIRLALTRLRRVLQPHELD
jgi:RNA polymerase sigma-70 factor (ECF subfamily)